MILFSFSLPKRQNITSSQRISDRTNSYRCGLAQFKLGTQNPWVTNLRRCTDIESVNLRPNSVCKVPKIGKKSRFHAVSKRPKCPDCKGRAEAFCCAETYRLFTKRPVCRQQRTSVVGSGDETRASKRKESLRSTACNSVNSAACNSAGQNDGFLIQGH